MHVFPTIYVQIIKILPKFEMQKMQVRKNRHLNFKKSACYLPIFGGTEMTNRITMTISVYF